jgi:tRNA threonylcarbamoyladenosine biosynthesis protein TsaE
MKITSEAEMINLGRQIAAKLKLPITLELIGDVGAGKTTLTKGIAKGFGISEEVNSPSFTISKHYSSDGAELVHYDFYRLSDPGLMSEDLEESISSPNTLTIVEWAETVANILPENRITIKITANDDDSREVNIKGLDL